NGLHRKMAGTSTRQCWSGSRDSHTGSARFGNHWLGLALLPQSRLVGELGHKRTCAVQSQCPLYPRKQTLNRSKYKTASKLIRFSNARLPTRSTKNRKFL